MKERKYKEEYRIEVTMDQRGRDRRKAVYQGDDFYLPERAGKKWVYAGMLTAYAFLYLFYMMLNSPGSHCIYVLPIAACAVIPSAYWAMGLFSMMRAPEKMTSTQKEKGIGRVMRSAMGCMILLLTACVGDVVFMIRSGKWTAELPAFSLLACAGITALGAFRHVKGIYDAIRVVKHAKE